jgi:hypothetical protein
LRPRARIASYAVLRELASHDKRAEIIQEHPDITKRAAQELMRKLKGGKKKNQELEWIKDSKRNFRELYNHAEAAACVADAWLSCTPEKQRELLEAVEPLMRDSLRGFARWLIDFADHFTQLAAGQLAAEQEAPEQQKAA